MSNDPAGHPGRSQSLAPRHAVEHDSNLMIDRGGGALAVAGLLGSTATGGLLFAPVFGLRALAPPVLAVILACYGCVELTLWRPRLAAVRPLLMVAAGGGALWAAILPAGEPLRTLHRGITEGWRLTLESTWPARPDPGLLVFVPLAVLLAAVLGVEILLRHSQIAALLPGLAVVGLAQAYRALDGFPAAFAAACYAVPAALVLWRGRPRLLLTGPAVVAMVAGAAGLGVVDPAGRDPYQIRENHVVALPPARLVNPLREIAQRLAEPGREVFRYRADEAVDRWRLVVLDEFDGVNWSTSARMLRMGARMEATAGTITRTADVQVGALAGPWLPSQPVPLGVEGLAPLVDPGAGTLLLEQPGPAAYRLTWSEPATLGEGKVDAQASRGLGGFGVIPAGIDELAKAAIRGQPPSLRAALQLERYLSTNYQRAEAPDLPTGHGWPQLRDFLLDSRRGTSEQFAAAYVLLARMSGIPARLVVGYRGGAEARGGLHIVRNSDVLAWPEVAIAGAGWVPLDPTPQAASGDTKPGKGLAGAAARAREQLPPEHELRPDPGVDETAPVADRKRNWLLVAFFPAGLAVGWVAGVPMAKALRTRLRRRRAGVAGVLAAWAEIRDRLAEHGVPHRIGMTPRDLADEVPELEVSKPVRRLGMVMDRALWSPAPPAEADNAWAAADLALRGLARRRLRDRIRAALDPRTLWQR